MKEIGWALFATGVLYLISIFIVSPILSMTGYSSVQASYHLQTDALLLILIFTVILCTVIGAKYIVEEIRAMKDYPEKERNKE